MVPGSVGIQKQIAATEPREPLGGLEEKTKLLGPLRHQPYKREEEEAAVRPKGTVLPGPVMAGIIPSGLPGCTVTPMNSSMAPASSSLLRCLHV